VRYERWAAALAAGALVAGAGCVDDGDEPRASQSTSEAPPVVGEDHWHAAFGMFVCDQFLPDPVLTESAVGIHTHGDGVIHIHPFEPEGAGANATLGVFLRDRPDIDLEDGGLEVDGVTWRDGEECHGEPARVVVARWDDAAAGGDPEIVTEDLTGLRFRADGEAYTVAFVPEGADIPLPPSAAHLAELGQADGPSAGSTDPGQAAGEAVPASGPVAGDGFYPVAGVVQATSGTCPAGTAGAAGNLCLTLGAGPVGMDAVDQAQADLQNGAWVVRLRLTDSGIDRFNALARQCFERAPPDCGTGQVAIVVGGRVQSAPTVNEPSYQADQIQISGAFDEAETRALAEAVAG
jgi:hypothetical protein